LTSTIDRPISSKHRFVFSDGHGLGSARLDQVVWRALEWSAFETMGVTRHER